MSAARTHPMEVLWPRTLGTAWLGEPPRQGGDPLLSKVLTQTVSLPMWTLMDQGGQRWRPAVCQAVYLACEGTLPAPEAAFEVVELLHNASLVVDDIQDGAVERRGGPAVHVTFGMEVALNAANAAYFRALGALRGVLPDAARLRALDMLGEELFTAHLGQALDLSLGAALQRGEPVDVTHYQALAAAKTGALVRLAARMGAIAAKASTQHEAAVARWAQDVGLAYQAKDDAQDVEEGLTDVEAGRITLPLMLLLAKLGAAEKTGVLAQLGKPFQTESHRKALVALMRDHAIPAACQATAKEYALAANQELAVLPAGPHQDHLMALTFKLCGE